MEVMSFSERHGYKNPAHVLEENDLPDALRNRIWNVLREVHFRYISDERRGYSTIFEILSRQLRHTYFKIPVDERSSNPRSERKFIRERYFQLQFPEFYEFLETMAGKEIASIYRRGDNRPIQFTKRCNTVFEQERARFRFVSNLVTRITSHEQMAEVEKAANTDEAGSHIHQAIELYRDMTSPDYRNSIKESVSAVEATYRRLTGEKHKDISAAIADMESKGVQLPKPLKAGFSNIYGWASGESGIRHALMDGDRTVTEAEARLMLVMCSAYVNYLLSLRERHKSV